MPASRRRSRAWTNTLQSGLLFAAMILICGLLGLVVAGQEGLVWALGLGAFTLTLSPGFSPRVILKLYNARMLAPGEAPALEALAAELARRASLAEAPALAYVPSQSPNAFSVGSRRSAVIALTDGLLRSLSRRELAGVLAHEISHVAHSDMWIMALADVVGRITALFSSLGWVLLILSLPMFLVAGYALPLTPILALLLAPAGTTLLQLALSRTREYDADLEAVDLTGDPEGLATALGKLEARSGGVFERILFPGRSEPHPSILRTHPETTERMVRILKMPRDPDKRLDQGQTGTCLGPGCHRPVRRPRWRPGGFWY